MSTEGFGTSESTTGGRVGFRVKDGTEFATGEWTVDETNQKKKRQVHCHVQMQNC